MVLQPAFLTPSQVNLFTLKSENSWFLDSEPILNESQPLSMKCLLDSHRWNQGLDLEGMALKCGEWEGSTKEVRGLHTRQMDR